MHRVMAALVVLVAGILFSTTTPGAIAVERDGLEASRAASPAAQAKQLARKVRAAKTPTARYRALLDVMKALNIGVYTGRLEPVVRGSEQSGKDFFLYDLEVWLLADALATESYTLDEMAERVTALKWKRGKPKITAGQLQKALREGTRAAVRKPTHDAALGALLLRELGLAKRPAYDLSRSVPPGRIKFDALQRFLVVMEIVAPWLRGQAPPDGLAVEPGQGPGTPKPCETILKNPVAKKGLKIGHFIADQIPFKGVLELPIEQAHAELLAKAVKISWNPVTSKLKAHYGPEGHFVGSDGTFLVFVARAFVRYPVDLQGPLESQRDRLVAEWVAEANRCAKVIDSDLELPEEGPAEGMTVWWDRPEDDGGYEQLEKHGSIIQEEGETNSEGEASLVMQMNDEEFPGEGALQFAQGNLAISADFVTLYGSRLGALVESLVVKRIPYRISWHGCPEIPEGLSPAAATPGTVDNLASCFPLRYRILSASISTSTTAEKTTGTGLCDLVGGTSGSVEFSGSLSSPSSQLFELRRDALGWVAGDFFPRIPAQWTNHTVHGCQIVEGDPMIVPCDYTYPTERPTPDGLWPTGFSVRGKPGARNVQLTWTAGSPSVGAMDSAPYPEYGCAVNIYSELDIEDDQEQRPLSTFLQTKPFTLTFSGSRTLTKDGLGRPATISYSWRISLTLKRLECPEGFRAAGTC